MALSFCFQGWVRGVEITEVTVAQTGEKIDVSDVQDSEKIKRLEAGEWLISLADHLYAGKKEEIEIFDWDEEA